MLNLGVDLWAGASAFEMLLAQDIVYTVYICVQCMIIVVAASTCIDLKFDNRFQDDMWEAGKSLDGRLNAAFHEFQAWAKIRKIPQLGIDVFLLYAHVIDNGMILGIVSLLSVMGNSSVDLMRSKWPPRATTCYTHECAV